MWAIIEKLRISAIAQDSRVSASPQKEARG
jgi:hypothetical protein